MLVSKSSKDCWTADFRNNIPTLGTPSPSKTDEFSEKFQKGGGGHFQSKNLYCKIWTFKQGYLTMKLIQRGLFRLCFSTIVLIKIKTNVQPSFSPKLMFRLKMT